MADVLCEIADGVATLTLNRPDRLNALITDKITSEQLDTFLYILGVLQSFDVPDES